MRLSLWIVWLSWVPSAACAEEESLIPERGASLCSDLVDNDRDGVTDCGDPGCSMVCIERDCSDGVDNDGNGVTDCGDPGCSIACYEGDCADGVDNDLNGDTDCDDRDCEVSESCGCLDGRDNDSNGKVDCDDSACAEAQACVAPPGMLVIGGGTFEKGCNGHSSTRPIHDVTVPTFMIDRAPITVEQYKVCIESGFCSAPPTYEERSYCTWGPQPELTAAIRCVTWGEARSFCESREMRLCSESEWEYLFEQGASKFGISALLISSTGMGAEFVEDCWVSSYGRVHPDGTVEITVPTDGSAVGSGDCSRRVVKTVTNLSMLEDAHCLRGSVETSEIYPDTFFRCCGDVESGE